MPRAYPPIWCKNGDCLECDCRTECVERTLELLDPYRDTQTPVEKWGAMELTTLAVYFGFCARLAKFFAEFPSFIPIPVVYSNFMDVRTGQPATQSIQRILLDTLASCDPSTITDEIFGYRGLFFSSIVMPANSYVLDTRTGKKAFSFTADEITRADQKLSELLEKTSKGNLDFLPSSDKKRCKICFLQSHCR